jgi:hypothetical protein
MTDLIVFGGLGALFVIISIVLLTGRGSFLLAGYNTMPKSEKAKYDTKALCKFFGKILLPIGVLAPFCAIEGITDWFVWVWVTVTTVLIVFALVYANTGNRFRK